MAQRPPRQHSIIVARLLGGAAALASCLSMVAMLPGGFAGTSSAAVAALSPHPPVTQPLLLVATGLLAVTSLRCSLLAVATATLGGALLYLSMYVFTRADGTAGSGCCSSSGPTR